MAKFYSNDFLEFSLSLLRRVSLPKRRQTLCTSNIGAQFSAKVVEQSFKLKFLFTTRRYARRTRVVCCIFAIESYRDSFPSVSSSRNDWRYSQLQARKTLRPSRIDDTRGEACTSFAIHRDNASDTHVNVIHQTKSHAGCGQNETFYGRGKALRWKSRFIRRTKRTRKRARPIDSHVSIRLRIDVPACYRRRNRKSATRCLGRACVRACDENCIISMEEHYDDCNNGEAITSHLDRMTAAPRKRESLVQ
jgi:hypothetical protein